jgi:hypothetical protein
MRVRDPEVMWIWVLGMAAPAGLFSVRIRRSLANNSGMTFAPRLARFGQNAQNVAASN